MGKHRSGVVAPQGRGKHRKPTTTGRSVARVAVAGVVLSAPMTMGAGVANASTLPAGVHVVNPSGVLDEIARCESGGSYTAQNPSSSASGKYQFIDSTWRAYRGSSSAARAKDASPAEQEAAAQRLYAAQGTTPWNASKSCWSGRVSAGSPIGGGSTSGSGTSQRAEKKQVQSKASDKPAAKKQVAEKPVKKAAEKQTTEKPRKKVTPKAANGKHRASGNGVHTVVTGDTLSGLALRYTGDASWEELHERNRKVVGDNPHLILPGQVLEVRK